MNIKSTLRPYYHRLQNLLKFPRRIGLRNRSVAIVSNNCGGGFISQYFGLPYHSPTVGLFFDTADYVRMTARLDHYLPHPLVFIDPRLSRHYDKFKPIDYPVAVCDDIEIFFMHYHSEREAEAAWRRRAERVDLDNVYILLFENDSTTMEDLKKFDMLPFAHKALVYSEYTGIRHFVRNPVVLDNDHHHWKPLNVIQSCDWKSEFNALKGKRK